MCIQSLKTDLKSTHLAADLVNIKTKGFLVHPQHNLFKILEALELCFMKHSEKVDPFTDTYEEFFQKENLHLSFPCALHKTEIFIDIFVMYITMRMRQHSYARNNENKKTNKSKKKISKLTTT